MRSVAAAVVCLACLALSCRVDCGLGTGGAGCETGGSGAILCRDDTDCAQGHFCEFEAERCPAADTGVIVTSRIQSSRCRPTLTDTRGLACSSSDDCAPDEACTAGLCRSTGSCALVLACPTSCVPRREPHAFCDVCICDC